MKKAVKNIQFEMDIRGTGVVNFDGDGQKWLERKRYDNVKYAKKNFYRDEEGEIVKRLKLSSNFLRNTLFKDMMVSHSASISNHPTILYSFLASPYALLTGYLLIPKNNISLKKKSVLNICDAEQTCSAEPLYETFTRGGEKASTSENDADDKGDTTLFTKESVGNIKYTTEGSIDLQGLEFYSCDQLFDRFAFNDDFFGMYSKFLSANIPGFASELGYYKYKSSSYDMSEYGFQMSQESRKYLLKVLMIQILNFRRDKTGAKVELGAFRVRVDSVLDLESKWVTISSEEDIDSFLESINLHDFYEYSDQEEAKKTRDDILKSNLEDNKKAKKKKAATKKK